MCAFRKSIDYVNIENYQEHAQNYMVWYDVIWCDMTWHEYNMAWYDIEWYSMGIIWYSKVWHIMIWHSMFDIQAYYNILIRCIPAGGGRLWYYIIIVMPTLESIAIPLHGCRGCFVVTHPYSYRDVHKQTMWTQSNVSIIFLLTNLLTK